MMEGEEEPPEFAISLEDIYQVSIPVREHAKPALILTRCMIDPNGNVHRR